MRVEHIGDATLYLGDCLESLKEIPDRVVRTCVTSPPYFGLRDYGVDGQIGQEKTPEEYTQKLVDVFSEVRRVLRDDGTLWLNLGDSYAGSGRGNNPNGKQGTNRGTRFDNNNRGFVPNGLKPKDLIGIPWRVAFALQADGWYLRQDIIWAKPNPMPESVTDRCTKSHEYIFLLSKSQKYYFNNEAIREDSADYEGSENRYKSEFGGTKNKQLLKSGQVQTRPIGMREFDGKRNKRDVWTITTSPYKAAHFATYPRELVQPCILAGSSEGDTVLDPFGGSGTTAAVALSLGRKAITCEMNTDYAELIKDRIKSEEAYQQPRLFDEPRKKAVQGNLL